jgi:outer membrane protein assembly factor BamE
MPFSTSAARLVFSRPFSWPCRRSQVLSLLAAGLCVLLSSCGSVTSFSFPGVYRIDIPQGNIITQEMVDQLRPGLTKRQVTFILGTPLLRDTFDQDRWDYLYSFQPGGGERAQEVLTVHFENNVLTSISGDFQQTPENLQFPSATTSTAPPAPTTSQISQ